MRTSPGQTFAVAPLMLIEAGVVGAVPLVKVTDFVLAVLFPQLFTAITEIVPLLVAGVTVMDVPVDVPDHPEGKVHE